MRQESDSVHFNFFKYSLEKRKEKKSFVFSIARCDEGEHHVLLDADVREAVQGVVRLSCLCVTSDGDGDKVVSL